MQQKSDPSDRHTATFGGSGIGKTNEKLAESCKGARLLEGKVFEENTDNDTFRKWAKRYCE